MFFGLEFKIVEIRSSELYDIIGCVVRRDEQYFLHLVSYRTPNPHLYTAIGFRGVAWEREFIREMGAVYGYLKNLGHDYEAEYISGDINLQLSGNSASVKLFRQQFESGGFINYITYDTHRVKGKGYRIDFLYCLSSNAFTWDRVQSVEKKGDGGHSGIFISLRDRIVTREITIIDDDAYLRMINVSGFEYSTTADPEQMIAELHNMLKGYEKTCTRTRTVTEQPEWIFSAQLAEVFKSNNDWDETHAQVLLDLFFDSRDYRKSYYRSLLKRT